MNDGSSLIRDIMFQLSGVPEDIARVALNHAMCELAECGCVFQPIVKVTTQNCVAQIKVEKYLPDGYNMLGFEYVKWCGRCIDLYDKCDPCPDGYAVDDLNTITLSPAPSRDSNDDLELCLNVQPDEDICSYPDSIVKRHKRTLIDGMKNYLMQMPDKPWSNNPLAAYHGRKFEAELASVQLGTVKQTSKAAVIATGGSWL